jgi:hypothetical protein
VSMGTCFLRSFLQDASALPPIGTPILDTDTMLIGEDSVYSGSYSYSYSGSGSGCGDMVFLSVEFNLQSSPSPILKSGLWKLLQHLSDTSPARLVNVGSDIDCISTDLNYVFDELWRPIDITVEYVIGLNIRAMPSGLDDTPVNLETGRPWVR